MTHNRTHLAVLAATSLTAVVSAADDSAVSATMVLQEVPPDALAGMTAQAKITPEYGAADSMWWSLGLGGANDFEDATDIEFFGSISYFLAKDVEFVGEGGAWFFSQPGDDTGGVSASMLLRWHFIHKEKWTLFADVGIGVLFAGDDVPAEEEIDGVIESGTPVNFLPRAGLGFTYQLSETGARLLAGLRWHHVSNGRLVGDDENPARDAPMLYASIVFPF